MVLAAMLLVAGAAGTPPVPGLCTAPASGNAGKPGCYLTATLGVTGAGPELFWTIAEFADAPAADEEARRHRRALVATAHGRTWLYVLDRGRPTVEGGTVRATVGPLRVPTGRVTARFLESTFPPGMRTRVHAHAGPEAFYVVDGEQCMESPSDRRRVAAGETYVVAGGPHVQAAPRGRRNLALVLAPDDRPWMTLTAAWAPTGFCD